MSKELNLEEWQQQIGKLIMSCTRVEYELSRLYKIWLSNRNFSDDSYDEKYNKSIGISKLNIGEHHEMIQQLVEMKKIATHRHLVAHNPVHYSNESSTWRILNLKSNKESIGLFELEVLAERAEILSLKLSANLRVLIR